MLLASPHEGLSAAFLEVICFHWPIGPAQTSGGCANDWRMTAEFLPSDEIETAVPHPVALICPGSCASVSTLPLLRSTVAIPASPSTSSPNMILSVLFQISVAAEAFISG